MQYHAFQSERILSLYQYETVQSQKLFAKRNENCILFVPIIVSLFIVVRYKTFSNR